MKYYQSLNKPFAGWLGAASIALAVPVWAIEKPAELEENRKNNKHVQQVGNEREAQPKERSAMLGVAGMPLSDQLSMHLQLGHGLTLYHVVPDSAAAKAGLKKNDIVTEFNGHKIKNQNDLRDAVQDLKPGDKVGIRFIHRGKVGRKDIVLGERPQALAMPKRRKAPHNLRDLRLEDFRQFGERLGLNVPEEDMERLHQQMLRNLNQFERQFGKIDPKRQQDLQRLLNNALQDGIPEDLKNEWNRAIEKGALRGKGLGAINFGARSSITQGDDEGSVTMNSVDGKKEVIVKDKKGQIIYEGPYQTPQDKAAVPDDIRERINRMKFQELGGANFKFHIAPAGIVPAPPAPLPADDDGAAE